jgi:hypothetical protein
MIQTCAEIHRQLWHPNKLAVGQGYGKNPRDEALLQRLAEKLDIPGESFIRSAESKGITAQHYLMAMLETIEPLSVMFEDIWRYCERTLTKTSRDALDISWNFDLHGERITINFEAFRRYRRLLTQVPPQEAFNTLCNAFANACSRYPRDIPDGPPELPDKPYGALDTSVAARQWFESRTCTGMVTGERLMLSLRFGLFVTAGHCGMLAHSSSCASSWINVLPYSPQKIS